MKKRRSDSEVADDIVALLNSEQDKARHPDMKIKSLLQQARDAGDGPLRMQYLQQVQKEVAKLNQTRNSGRIDRIRGEVLALGKECLDHSPKDHGDDDGEGNHSQIGYSGHDTVPDGGFQGVAIDDDGLRCHLGSPSCFRCN